MDVLVERTGEGRVAGANSVVVYCRVGGDVNRRLDSRSYAFISVEGQKSVVESASHAKWSWIVRSEDGRTTLRLSKAVS